MGRPGDDEVVIRSTEDGHKRRESLVEPKPPRYKAIIEGRCPTCEGALERRERDGWCVSCNVGWAYRTEGRTLSTVSLTIEPCTAELSTSLGRFTSTSARVTFTSTGD